MDTKDRCYLCYSDVDIIYELNTVNGAPRIVRCRKCAFQRLSPVPNKSTIEQIYTRSSSEKRLEFEVSSSKFLTTLRRKIIIEPILKRLKNHVYAEKDVSLLDIGCSTGWKTSIAKNLGFRVTGLEINPQFARFGREKYKIKIVESYIEEFDSNEKFNSITMFHVLEHLPYPLAALKKIRGLLKHKGKVLIVVPNTESIGARIFKKNYNWNAPYHITFFSPSTIDLILAKAGFKVIELNHLDSPPLLLYSFNNLMANRDYNSLVVTNALLGNIIFTPLSFIGKLIKKGEVIAVYAEKD